MVLITSHTLFHLFIIRHWDSYYYLSYGWGTSGTECRRNLHELPQLWLVDPGYKLTKPESRAHQHRPMPSLAMVQESMSARLGERASMLQFSLANQSLVVPVTALLPNVLLWSPETSPPATTGVAVSPSYTPGPHLDIKVMHSLSGRRWLTFVAPVLSIAVFILTQEEHTRTQNGD